MRGSVLTAVLLAVCGLAPLCSQPATPHPPAVQGRGQQPTIMPQAAGPVIDASALGSPVLLDKGWRVGITTNQDPAQPDFDDSGWAVRNAASAMEDVSEHDEGHDQGHDQGRDQDKDTAAEVSKRRYAWFRLHIRLAPNHGPVALLVEMPVVQSTTVDLSSTGPAVTVFANGQAIDPDGPNGTDPQQYQAITRIYDLKVPAGETSVMLAVRTIYIPVGYNSYTTFFATRTLRLGDPQDLERALRDSQDRTVFEQIPKLVYSLLLIVLAGFLFVLYFAQRGHNEYLWLALHELVQAPIGFVVLAGTTAHLDTLWYGAIMLQLLLASAYLFFEFLISFLSLRSRWYIKALRYTAPILAGVAPTLLLVGHIQWVGILLAIVFLGSLVWTLAWLIFIFVTLIAATLRRNFEAGLLLIPLVLTIVGVAGPVITAALNDVSGRPNSSPLTLFAGPIPIHFAAVADFAGVLAIVIIIFGRFLRIQREQERASSELAAARSMQELMLPREKVATPGFEVDSVYIPATEVGGDFFHVQTMGDGSVLVVIGDVAGKGLKAAMTVSMVMGALRRTNEQRPARILEVLNRVLTGGEGFTTCQAALFGADGELALASAGHLPPYLNSQEIVVPGSLPLGVMGDIHLDEVRLYLHPGDRLLLMSDGVVEARKPSGELFGFDRVHDLTRHSAYYIADTAKVFGQVDDITVLTVRRLSKTAEAPEGVAEVETLATAPAS